MPKDDQANENTVNPIGSTHTLMLIDQNKNLLNQLRK
jgi:hypothetical protein